MVVQHRSDISWWIPSAFPWFWNKWSKEIRRSYIHTMRSHSSRWTNSTQGLIARGAIRLVRSWEAGSYSHLTHISPGSSGIYEELCTRQISSITMVVARHIGRHARLTNGVWETSRAIIQSTCRLNIYPIMPSDIYISWKCGQCDCYEFIQICARSSSTELHYFITILQILLGNRAELSQSLHAFCYFAHCTEYS